MRPLLLHLARFGLPIILSTGMATLGEVERALGVIAFGYLREATARPTLADFSNILQEREAWVQLQSKVTLLHCTTEYPAVPHSINLKAMATLRSAFGLPVGFSDHSAGFHIAVAAAALGAVVIEKHFTMDRSLPGPDHRASLEPDELATMIECIRDVERAMGDGRKVSRGGRNRKSQRGPAQSGRGGEDREGRAFQPRTMSRPRDPAMACRRSITGSISGAPRTAIMRG